MRKGWIGLAALAAAVVFAVVLLREPPAAKPSPPPAPTATEPSVPRTREASRNTVFRLNWREVPLPAGVEQPERSVVDAERAVFPVLGSDGAHRLVTKDGVEVARGAEPLTAMLDGGRLVVWEADAGRLSTVDLATGARSGPYLGAKPGPVAGALGVVVVQRSEQCLTFLDAATLEPRMDQCAQETVAVSLLTSEFGAVQWRQARPDERCARWFRMSTPYMPEVVSTGERGCRAAVLLHAGEWELTADFPPYEVGVANPGPLVARKGEWVWVLDASALGVHTCGGRVYWVSHAVGAERRGRLVRWAPGDPSVEVLEVGSGDVSPSRCVNGVVNVVTHGADRPRLWTLAEP